MAPLVAMHACTLTARTLPAPCTSASVEAASGAERGHALTQRQTFCSAAGRTLQCWPGRAAGRTVAVPYGRHASWPALKRPSRSCWMPSRPTHHKWAPARAPVGWCSTWPRPMPGSRAPPSRTGAMLLQGVEPTSAPASTLLGASWGASSRSRHSRPVLGSHDRAGEWATDTPRAKDLARRTRGDVIHSPVAQRPWAHAHEQPASGVASEQAKGDALRARRQRIVAVTSSRRSRRRRSDSSPSGGCDRRLVDFGGCIAAQSTTRVALLISQDRVAAGTRTPHHVKGPRPSLSTGRPLRTRRVTRAA